MSDANASDPIESSFALAGERDGDFTDHVYERYFTLCPEAQELLGHADEHMRGRMLEDVLMLLMTPPADVEEGYVEWEVENHVGGYAVTPEMYRPLFGAVRDVVRAALGSDYDADTAQAWEARAGGITDRFEATARGYRSPLHEALR